MSKGPFTPSNTTATCESGVIRVDLHCHSDASNLTSEAVLKAIDCPESFSSPDEVYSQAKRRGMNFVTISDHDSIDGVAKLIHLPDVLIGEELTCFFPEDRCKIHLLIWGLTPEDHFALQSVASDIYKVAEEVELRNLAHSVAHPVYRQNDRLERWHLERLILMFKGFETLNGSHSVLHRQSLEPLLDSLTPAKMCELATVHRIPARWSEPHIKSRTGGSDDHGLFNIGRTWTEFPAGMTEIGQLLDCIRTAKTKPGGEAGSSLKLAHNFYGVGIRYYQRRIQRTPRTGTTGLMLKSLVGGPNAIRRRDVVRAMMRSKAKSFKNRIIHPFRRKTRLTGTALFFELFKDAARRRIQDDKPMLDAIRSGQAALGEHEAMFKLVSGINRDVAAGIADSVVAGLVDGEMADLFDAVSAVTAHQFLLLPYYFALFHQNQERPVLARITGCSPVPTRERMKVGVFTDTFDEINGVGNFIRDINREATLLSRSVLVATCTTHPSINDSSRCNFIPLLSRPLPYYPDQPLTIPPLAEIMEWADRQQFDAIHIHTPGPMGLCGWVVAKMLRVPLVGTYHTDFPQYVQQLTGDHRITTATTAYTNWLYRQNAVTLSRSKAYLEKLQQIGIDSDRLALTLAGVDTSKFNPTFRNAGIWGALGITKPFVLLYVGRVSVEKNLPFLCRLFKKLCATRSDVALAIVGDGPYRAPMESVVANLPVHFLGVLDETTTPTLATIFASADLFVFPSKTDTLGQVILEAQASGLPVLVSGQGGPKEAMDDGITGQVIPAEDHLVWAEAVDRMLNDGSDRLRMGRTACQRAGRFSTRRMFDAFWDTHYAAVQAFAQDAQTTAPHEAPSF